MASLHLTIATPDGISYEGDVQGVVVPAVEGEVGILPQHLPLVTEILPGELRIQTAKQEVRMAVGEGFLEVGFHHVAVMTEMAARDIEIDEKSVEEAIARAQERIQEGSLQDEELATVQASLQRSLAKLRVKRRLPY